MAKSLNGLVISIPCYSGIVGSSFRSHLELTNKLRTLGINHTYSLAENLGDIVTTRNFLVSSFLYKSDAEAMLMVDSDIEFMPSTVLEMVESGLDFIGAAVPMRRLNYKGLQDYIDRGETELWTKSHLCQFNIDTKVKNAVGSKIIDVDAIGAAFLFVRRSAIERMANAYPELEHKDSQGRQQIGLFNHLIDPVTRQQYGEDIGFCRRWAALGGKMHAVVNAHMTHTGPIRLEGNLYDVSDKVDPYAQHARSQA